MDFPPISWGRRDDGEQARHAFAVAVVIMFVNVDRDAVVHGDPGRVRTHRAHPDVRHIGLDHIRHAFRLTHHIHVAVIDPDYPAVDADDQIVAFVTDLDDVLVGAG